MRSIMTMLTLTAIVAATAAGADTKAGHALYDKACRSCHGADGTANAAIAKMMKVEMRDLKSPEVQAARDNDLKKLIVYGKGKMKPVKSVTGGAADDVVAYIRSLKKRSNY